MAKLSYKTLLRQTALSALLSFLTFAFGFVRVSYFSKRMSMEDFGILSLLLSYSALLFYVFTLGSFQYLFKRVNEGDAARKSGLWSALSLTAIISFAGTLITFTFSDPICSYLNISQYQTDFKLAVLGTATTSIMMTFLFYHYGLGRNNFQNLLQFLRGSLWVIVSILASFTLGLSLTQVLYIFNISIFLILLIAIPWKELPVLFPVSKSLISFGPMLRYCIPLFPYFAGIWGIPAIIRSQLNIFEGPKSVALFNVAFSLMEIVFLFISTIAGTLSPHFFAKSEEENKPALVFNIMLKYSILLVVLVLPFVYITRFDVILLLTSIKYYSAGNYIPLLAILPLLRILILVFEQVYLKEAKTLFLGSVYGIVIALSLILSTILIPKYSVMGAIYTALTSYAFLFLCLFLKQFRKVDYAFQNLFAVLGLTLILWVSVFLVDRFHFHSFLKALPIGLVAGISLFLLPVFTAFEKSKFLSLIKIKYASK